MLTMRRPRGSMRHFEFHHAGSLGMHLGRDRYPIEIREVDEGTPAHQQGVPPNSVVVRLNEQQLKPNDGQDVREHVINMLNERPVTFDVVAFEELSDLQTAEEDPTVRRICECPGDWFLSARSSARRRQTKHPH